MTSSPSPSAALVRAVEWTLHRSIPLKSFLALLFSAGLVCAGFASELVMLLKGNGQLTWTNSVTNAAYRIEWASSLAGPWQQFSALTNLDSIAGTNTTLSVSVPMFYRLVWTNPPLPQPLGEWDFNGYSFDGSLVVTGQMSLTNRVQLWGPWTFAAVPNGTNTWSLDCLSGEAHVYPWTGPTVSMILGGCGFGEGVFLLEGSMIGDTYSGTWFAEGIALSPIGTFIARKRPG